MLLRPDGRRSRRPKLSEPKRLTWCERWQATPFRFLLALVVAHLLVELAEAGEAEHALARPQEQMGRAVDGLRLHLHPRQVEDGVGHLAGDEALPDERIEPKLVAA